MPRSAYSMGTDCAAETWSRWHQPVFTAIVNTTHDPTVPVSHLSVMPAIPQLISSEKTRGKQRKKTKAKERRKAASCFAVRGETMRWLKTDALFCAVARSSVVWFSLTSGPLYHHRKRSQQKSTNHFPVISSSVFAGDNSCSQIYVWIYFNLYRGLRLHLQTDYVYLSVCLVIAPFINCSF